MTKINPRSRRSWHKHLVMYEMNHKNLHRDIDADWPRFINWQSKCMHLPKYHGTKYRGQKRWMAKGKSIAKSIAKVTKGDKNE